MLNRLGGFWTTVKRRHVIASVLAVSLCCMDSPNGMRAKGRINVKADVRIGMSEVTVFTLIGGEPGDYSLKKGPFVVYDSFVVGLRKKGRKYRISKWATDEGEILVWFDKNGRVERVVHGKIDEQGSRIDKLLELLRSIWHHT